MVVDYVIGCTGRAFWWKAQLCMYSERPSDDQRHHYTSSDVELCRFCGGETPRASSWSMADLSLLMTGCLSGSSTIASASAQSTRNSCFLLERWDGFVATGGGDAAVAPYATADSCFCCWALRLDLCELLERVSVADASRPLRSVVLPLLWRLVTELPWLFRDWIELAREIFLQKHKPQWFNKDWFEAKFSIALYQ